MPDNPGGLVYGTIIVATLLAAESPRRETYADTVAAVAIALLTYWLTVAYVHYAGERLEHGEHFQPAGFARAAGREVTLLVGGALPLLELLIAWALGVSLPTAVTIDVWFTVALIVSFEVVIGVRADLRGRDLVAQTSVGVLLAVAVVGVRVLLH